MEPGPFCISRFFCLTQGCNLTLCKVRVCSLAAPPPPGEVYLEASSWERCWLAVAGEVIAILGREGKEKAENADLALMLIILNFVLSGPRGREDLWLEIRNKNNL